MSMVFELWDTESCNLLDVYESEDDALRDVFAAMTAHGPRAVATLLLGQDEGEHARPIARGAELARRAQAWHDRSHAKEYTKRRGPAAR